METILDTAIAELLHAAGNVLWKVNGTMQTRDGAIVDRTITRRDATIHLLKRAVARYEEIVDPSQRLCGQNMCDFCESRWCEDGQD